MVMSALGAFHILRQLEVTGLYLSATMLAHNHEPLALTYNWCDPQLRHSLSTVEQCLV